MNSGFLSFRSKTSQWSEHASMGMGTHIDGDTDRRRLQEQKEPWVKNRSPDEPVKNLQRPGGGTVSNLSLFPRMKVISHTAPLRGNTTSLIPRGFSLKAVGFGA